MSIYDLNHHTISHFGLIGIIEYSIQQQQNIYLPQAHMEHSPRQTTLQAIKHTLTNLNINHSMYYLRL